MNKKSLNSKSIEFSIFALLILGFGSLSAGGYVASELQHVELAHVPRNTCDNKYSPTYSVDQFMMCASDPGQDSCQGDSGG